MIVAIIGTMLAVAVMDVGAGMDSARVKAATRGVLQLSRHARTMALLKQRPADIAYSADGRITVTLRPPADGDSLAATIGPLAAPVSIPADADADQAAAAEDAAALDAANGGAAAGGSATNSAELASAPEDLIEDSTSRAFDGIAFAVEVLGDDGQPLEREPAAPRFAAGDDEEDDGSVTNAAPAITVTYETNGRCPPYRVTIFKAGTEPRDGLVVDVDRFGKVKVDDER